MPPERLAPMPPAPGPAAPEADNLLQCWNACDSVGLDLWSADEPLDQPRDRWLAEMRTAHPDRPIHGDIELSRPVICDGARIGQLLSNLLANALTHGAPAGPVWVRARSHDDGFELSVANLGDPIRPETVSRLFLPYARGSDKADLQGLGLGLYIASEIARAHEGSLEVASTQEETRFTFRMPAASVTRVNLGV